MVANRPSLLTLILASLFICALFIISPSRLLPSAAASAQRSPATSGEERHTDGTAARAVTELPRSRFRDDGLFASFGSLKFLLQTAPTDFVVHWKLDEGSGTVVSDSTGGNSTGTLNGPTWSAGRIGAGGLNFDGIDDRVAVTGNLALNGIPNNFTLSFWAYPRSTHQIDAEGYIWGGTSGQRYALGPGHGPGSDAGAGVSVGTNGVSIYEHGDNYMPASLVYQGSLSGWTHITVVYENKQPKLYINGALVRTGITSQRTNVLLYPQDIGGMAYGFFDGQLDDIHVYNRALNATEISSLATAGAGSNPATDFAAAQNPNGVWSYGWRPAAGGVFKLYPNHDQPSGNGGTWYDAAISDPYNTPQVSHTIGNPLVHMHPGPQGQSTIVRWTAPTATTVNISGRFENMNAATTDVHIVYNSSAALFDGAINGAGSVAPFSVRKTVAAGDTLDFVVGWGSNGTYYSDSTGLALNIAPDPGSPYDDTKTAVPGTIETERFNNGGEGAGYHDTTPGTHGQDFDQPPSYPPPTFRQPTDVDMYKYIGYSNGYFVLMQAGEWMKYTIDVAATGTYKLKIKTFWGDVAGGNFHIEIDGVDKTGPMQIPNSAWTQATITGPNLQLSAGRHTMRVVADTNGTNGSTGEIDSIIISGINDAAFISQSIPTSMVAGQTYSGTITMQNTGTTTWSSAGYYNLGSQNPQDNTTWGGARLALPGAVTPGSTVTLSFSVKAPSTPGTYNLQARMVQDTVEWFGAFTSNVAVTVTAQPNQLPKANAGGPQTGMVGYPVQFKGDGSSDPDGTIASYSWNFGDGQTASGANPTHTYAAGGNYVVTLTVTDNLGASSTATTTVAVIDTTQSSYLNNSKAPGTIQAEDFDNGGPEVAYHDDSPGNQGGSATYRAGENVDIENNTASNGGYVVGWTRAGEWLEYIVQVADTDNYKFEAQVASPIDGGTGGVFHVEVDGGNVTGPITVPNTGSSWTTVSKSGLRLNAGSHVMRVVMESGGSTGYVGRFDYFRFTATQSPYGGAARPLPGTIQAEDFDNGEQGTSYSDTTPGNQGGAYRSTDVDIWNSSEGPAVGWGQKGEWLDYTVDVSQNGSYTVAARVASPGAGATFHLEVDEFAVTMPVAVPATGSRDTWQTVQTSVKLPAGRHILRLVIDDAGAGGEVCFNSLTVSLLPKDPTKDPAADALLFGPESYPDVDYTTVGVGNLINPSNNGTLALSGIRNVKKAFLFWWGVPNGILHSEKIVFADVPITGSFIAPAHHGEKYFGAESDSFRADVTDIVRLHGNFGYKITTTTCLGASLIVLWDDGNPNNNRDITLFAGNDGNRVFGRPDGWFDPEGWDSSLPGINYTAGSGTAIVQLHVAEGERQPETPLTFTNGSRQIVYPRPTDPFDFFGPDLFQGRSVPPGSNSSFDPVSLWDIRDFDVTSILNNGQNTVRITAGRNVDTLFLVLAVVNVPHPPPAPTVTITDANNRVSGNLDKTVQKSLVGGQIVLKANGNSSGGSYAWTFTGPFEVIAGANTNTVTFTTKDDGTLKSFYPVTAKVVFTNSANVKAEATVNINAQLPTVPEYTGTPSKSTYESSPGDFSVIWQMGSSNFIFPEPAMTFNARAVIPAGPYLSDQAESFIFFQQAINTMRKVRDSWGRVSCKTSRNTQEDTDENIRSGWRFDDRQFRNLGNANKNFSQADDVPGARSLRIDLREGIEGLSFRMDDVDAALVDDRYETYVMYTAGNYSRRLGSIKWRWGGTLLFDTTPEGERNKYPPLAQSAAVYKLRNDRTTTGIQQQTVPVSDTDVQGLNTNPPLTWGQCPGEHDQPTRFRIIDNQHFYVYNLYLDFLKRDPVDDNAFNFSESDREGYFFWSSSITKNGFDEAAIDGYHVQTGLAFIFSNDPVLLQSFPDLAAPRHTDTYNRAFVRACYLGFLKRRPEDLPDGPEMPGFFFWLNELNTRNSQTNDSAYFEVVHAFLVSEEYLNRFPQNEIDEIEEDFDHPAPDLPQQ